MEHLPVHLPYEAALGGPVQFRWMYLYERQMNHLKQKAKNKAKYAGSIVAHYITEEISQFSSYYFAADGRGTHHHQTTQGEIQFTYDYPDVPSMFQPIGRVSGKSKEAWLTEEDAHILHTFLLLNCEEIEPYERYIQKSYNIIIIITNTTNNIKFFYHTCRLYEDYMRIHQPGITEKELTFAKENDFAYWCRDYVSFKSYFLK